MRFLCERCGTEYHARLSAGRKYCSQECYYAASVVERPKSVCPQCGKEFEWKRSHKPQCYCSRGCANDAKRRYYTRECEQCGTVFALTCKSDARRFCSPECFGESQKTATESKCLICGKAFLVVPAKREAGRGKYCSNACYHKSKGRQVKRVCEQCGAEFEIIPAYIRKGGGKYCSKDCFLLSDSNRAHGYAKGGKRKDLNNVYFRSSWEANYARILNHLVDGKLIKGWEFEPDLFDFGDERYLPDFKITNAHGDTAYHEVKGWMDETSKRKLTKMRKFYPDVPVVLIDSDEYKILENTYAPMIQNWEASRWLKIPVT